MRAGLIGSGIAKSRTPAMHMHEGRLNGMDYQYDLIDLSVLGVGVEALASLIDSAEAQGFAGVNITHPCKQKAIQFVDELSQDGAALGAINTITFANGQRKGHNTDWWGFAKGFRRSLPDATIDAAVLIGAGGAGVAVAHALASMGTRRLHVVDINAANVEALIGRLRDRHPECTFLAATDMEAALSASDGVAHATPTGMVGHPGVPLDSGLLSPRQWVAEIVYFPLQTQLLREAHARGCQIVNGGGMAVYQAVGAFELFTGVAPDADRMFDHFRALGEADDT